jgi:hypothetical protein
MLKGLRRKVLGSVAAVALAGTLSAAGASTLNASPASAHAVGWDSGGNYRYAYAGYDGSIHRYGDWYWCLGYHKDMVVYPRWGYVSYPNDTHYGWYQPVAGWTSNGTKFWNCNYGY